MWPSGKLSQQKDLEVRFNLAVPGTTIILDNAKPLPQHLLKEGIYKTLTSGQEESRQAGASTGLTTTGQQIKYEVQDQAGYYLNLSGIQDYKDPNLHENTLC